MKQLKKIILILLLCVINISYVYADTDKNLVNIYLFYSDTCPHCASEIKLLNELADQYDNIEIYKYEISNDNNYELLNNVATLFNTKVTGVPFAVVGNRFYKGYNSENSKRKFITAIEYYSQYGYQDIVGEYLGNSNLPTYPIDESAESLEEFAEDYENVKIGTIFGTINTKNLTLPVISLLIGLVDGFNPCAMWVLLFLISMLIGMKDKKRMWILGLTFIITSALIYLFFMLAWLNLANLLITVTWIRTILGLIAITGAIININSYLKTRKTNGCTVVNDKKRNKIFTKIKQFTHEKSLLLSLLGIITLAISVNIVELACSAGLPVMFIEILSLNNLTAYEEAIYILIYMFFFMIDDLIVFFIAMRTMQLTGFSTKYGKLSKIIGGILLLLIGLLLIFKPEWLMFNF